MHILKVIAGGFALLGIMLFLARKGGVSTPGGMAKLFIPVWFAAAALNMWIGVTQAGYTVAEEAPIFALVFAVPAIVAWLVAQRNG